MDHKTLDAAKQAIEAEMRKQGLWRDDIEPVWLMDGDVLSCHFPTHLHPPVVSPEEQARIMGLADGLCHHLLQALNAYQQEHSDMDSSIAAFGATGFLAHVMNNIAAAAVLDKTDSMTMAMGQANRFMGIFADITDERVSKTVPGPVTKQ